MEKNTIFDQKKSTKVRVRVRVIIIISHPVRLASLDSPPGCRLESTTNTPTNDILVWQLVPVYLAAHTHFKEEQELAGSAAELQLLLYSHNAKPGVVTPLLSATGMKTPTAQAATWKTPC